MDYIQILIGLIVALVAIIIFEWLVSPRLEVRRAQPHTEVFDYPSGNPTSRFIKLEVINKPLKFPGLTFLSRRVAKGCKAYVEIIDATTNHIVPSPPLPQHVKWTSSPEGRFDIDPNTGKMMRFIDSSMIPHIETIDVGPSAPQTLDLFVKQKGDKNFYLHSGENLMHPTYQQPINKLDGPAFYVTVRIIAENASSKSVTFMVLNNGVNLQNISLQDVFKQTNKTDSQKPWFKIFTKASNYLYFLAMLLFFGLVVYGFTLFESLTKVQKLSYILPSISAFIALLVTFFEVKNIWASIAIIIAINLFTFGLLMQLISITTQGIR